MINKPTCYKNPEKPFCIDLILTNCPLSFQNSCAIETGLLDYHKMVATVTKKIFRKLEPKLIKYRDYKYFCNDIFREFLQNTSSQNLKNICDNTDSNCENVLDKIAPCTKKYVRGDNLLFMNKTQSKAIR